MRLYDSFARRIELRWLCLSTVGVPPALDNPHASGLRWRMLGCAEQAAVDEFAAWVRDRFGGRLRELDLFGSHSRNEAHLDSDVDIRVVVDDLSSAEGREIAHRAGDLLTVYDVIVSPFAVSAARMRLLRERERLIAREIDHDAIPLP